MWMFTGRGFYSVVAPDTGGDLMIRGRVRGDLESRLPILEPFARSRRVIETPRADYRYRLVVDTDEWLRVAEVLAAEVDYPNFKAKVASSNPARAATYGRVWHIHHDELEREDRSDS